MRGYGGSAAPAHPSEYTFSKLAGDVLGLLERIGARRAALVAHDHGANLGWRLVLELALFLPPLAVHLLVEPLLVLALRRHAENPRGNVLAGPEHRQRASSVRL